MSHPSTVNSPTEATPLRLPKIVNEPAEEKSSNCGPVLSSVKSFVTANSFLLRICLSVFLAKMYPPLGAVYVHPEITASWIAVLFIFLMAGVTMKTEALKEAFGRLPFNLFVQGFNFGGVSFICFCFTRFILAIGGPLTKDMANAMVVGACMPCTVTMVIVLTRSAGGDEASAIFNAAFGSFLGVFVSPALILLYTGMRGSVDMTSVFCKLFLRVVVPVMVGQIIRNFSHKIMSLVEKHKKTLKTTQETCLCFIIFTVFSKTFSKSSTSSEQMKISQIIWLCVYQVILFGTVMALAWACLRVLYYDEPHLRIFGIFGCTQKSVAMGIPLITALYEHDPNVGLYTIPLLIWHPLQLVIGSMIAPRLAEGLLRVETWKEFQGSRIRRASLDALARVSLVAWESVPDLEEIMREAEEEML